MARIGTLYLLFAILATCINLGCQMVSVRLYEGIYSVEFSILVGTAAGLLAKYVLDKRYIFRFKSDGLAHDGRLLMLYSGMGLLTTIIFWGLEYLFHRQFQHEAMRYLGGALGLALGYIIKYRLDKRFVFVGPRPIATGIA